MIGFQTWHNYSYNNKVLFIERGNFLIINKKSILNMVILPTSRGNTRRKLVLSRVVLLEHKQPFPPFLVFRFYMFDTFSTKNIFLLDMARNRSKDLILKII